MNHYYSMSPAEAVKELDVQFRILKYAIATLEPITNIPEVQDVHTLLDNMQLAVDLYLGELKQLCPTPDTKDGLETPANSLPTDLSGTPVKPSPTGYQLPLPIAS